MTITRKNILQQNNWIDIARDEHTQRNALEFENKALKDTVRALQHQLKSIKDYNAYMEHKVTESETQRKILQNKLQFSIDMLRKAKHVLRKRKTDVTALAKQNAQLTTELQSEKFTHAQTQSKLEDALERLKLRTNGVDYKTMPNREFAFRMLYRPETLPITEATQVLQKDVALIQEMLYLDSHAR